MLAALCFIFAIALNDTALATSQHLELTIVAAANPKPEQVQLQVLIENQEIFEMLQQQDYDGKMIRYVMRRLARRQIYFLDQLLIADRELIAEIQGFGNKSLEIIDAILTSYESTVLSYMSQPELAAEEFALRALINLEVESLEMDEPILERLAHQLASYMGTGSDSKHFFKKTLKEIMRILSLKRDLDLMLDTDPVDEKKDILLFLEYQLKKLELRIGRSGFVDEIF